MFMPANRVLLQCEQCLTQHFGKFIARPPPRVQGQPAVGT